jgi:dolichyl-phosphate beta-glucosyltransferase
MTTHPAISIVIPAYNESARITATLSEVLRAIRQYHWDAEVIVVDDGSTDNTIEIVNSFRATAPEIDLVEVSPNRGKGFSVRTGMLRARGEIVLFTDADLSAPIDEARSLFDAIRAGADVAIGSRWLDAGRQVHRQPLYRQFFGRCFNQAVRTVMDLPYADTQCGFKAFTRVAAHVVSELQTIERWGFDPEILFIARERGFLVKEVSVAWAHDSRSKVSYLRDGVRMLRDMATIRSRALLGRYDRKVSPVERYLEHPATSPCEPIPN